MMGGSRLIGAAAILAAAGVALGAFGAHALEGALQDWGLTPAERAARQQTWDVAVRYQLFHSLGLLCLGLLAARLPARGLAWSAGLMMLGMLIFCGCLYTLVLSGIKLLGAVVPLGGVCLIAGWVVLALTSWRADKTPGSPVETSANI